MTGVTVDIELVEKTFGQIKDAVSKQILSYYVTSCPKCNNDSSLTCSIWETGKDLPSEMRFRCNICGKNINKKPNAEDSKRIQQIQKQDIPFWHPKVSLRYSDTQGFMKREKAETLDDLFTRRNLICLSILFNEINKIHDDTLRALFLFRFTSMVHLASKMTPDRPSRPHSSFWAVQSYWVPPKNMESNVWNLFESAISERQGLMVGKEDSNTQITLFKEAREFDDLKSDSNILLLNQSALHLSNIPSNSVDYVFTDPPYGGSVQYFELSTLWCSWLNKNGQFAIDYSGEITINGYQKKNFDFYHNMLKNAFQEVYRVLKSGKYLTVTFHNTKIEIYNSILKAAVLAGFDLEKVVYQPPARPSAKHFLQPFGSAVGDYYIRFMKPQQRRSDLPDAEQIDQERYERIIVNNVTKAIAHRGEPTPYSFIINSYSEIYDELKSNGYLFSASDSIDSVLKKYLDKQFVLVPKKDGKGKTIGKFWWFKNPSSIPFLERTPLSERVENSIIDLLNKFNEVTFNDIVQYIFTKFPNSLTPETSSIDSILKEYAEKVKGGKWRLKPIVQDRENEHDRIVQYLCELGKKARYEVYGDAHPWRTKLRLKMQQTKLARIREIDVLWYKDGKIYYEFEVENSTGITEAIVRGTNIDYPLTRIIIIPEERENLLSRKVQEPMLAERIENDKWKFVRYRDFYALYARQKHKNDFDLNELLHASKSPRATKSTMESLDKYIQS
jgi:hypothetical protein